MKKLLTIVAATVMMIAQSASAQDKGEKYIGGGLGFSVGSRNSTMALEDIKERVNTSLPSEFDISGSFGYFVEDNIRVSVTLKFGTESDKGENTTNIVNSFLVGPEVAYYVPLARGFYFTPELGLYFGGGSESTKTGSAKISYTFGAYGMNLHLGQFEFRPTDRLGVGVNTISLKYGGAAYEKESFKVQAGQVKFCFSPEISIRYYL